MKKIISLFLGLMICFSLSSCVTTAYAQGENEEVDVNVVVTYGTPYYNTDGLLLYYVFRDLFYYPYYYNNRWYFRHYSRPLPPRTYRPIPRDFYKHRPNITHHRPNVWHSRPQAKPNIGLSRPSNNSNRGFSGNHSRPMNHSGRTHHSSKR